MILAHDRVAAPGAEPARWMLVLHGIYGAGRNWGSVARRFVRARPEWGVLLVDLRLHGGSRGFAPPHTLEACVDDLGRLVAHTGLPVDALLGHSFGGKVALLYLAETGATSAARSGALGSTGGDDGFGGEPRAAVRVPSVTWVVESTPAERPPEGSAWKMLGVLRSHPGPFADRAEAITAVESSGFSNAVAQWMATNAVPASRVPEAPPLEHARRSDADGGAGSSSDAELIWRLDPDDMEALLRDFFATDAWPVLEHPPEGARIHVVRARESRVLDEVSRGRILRAGQATRGRVRLHEVSGGHWVNADDPEGLQRLLVESMP